MADVDDFKEINDRFGHPLGDRVLIEIAGVLTASVRDIDIVCRYAGDEFVLILPDVGEEGGVAVVKRVEESMTRFPWGDRLEVPIKKVSLSMGYAVLPDHTDRVDELIEKADKALYYSKKVNKPFCSYSDDIETDLFVRKCDQSSKAYPMLGRTREKKVLFKILEQVLGEKGRLVLIRGELGMGKTVLINELEDRAKMLGFAVFKGNCFPETRDNPFHPLFQVVESVLKSKDNPGLTSGLPEVWREEVKKILCAEDKELKISDEIESGLREELYQEEFRIFEVFSSFLNTISSSTPVMISLENLQWVDPSSIKLLKYIGRQIRNKRVLICGTVREKGFGGVDGMEMSLQHELQSLKEENYLTEIDLDGLKEMEIYALIDKKVEDKKIDRAFKDKIFHLSEGNPLFAKEILNYLLREKRTLLEETKSWDVVPLDEIIPPNIWDLFERSFANLDEEVNSVLSYAAVIGNEFDFSILMTISGKNEGHLLDIIDMAVREGLIKEIDREEGDHYAFTPFLIGRLLYRGLGAGKRRVLHKKVGEVLEIIHAKSLVNYYGVISYHFQRAGEYKKAIRYATLAGERAQEVYAQEEAVAFYSSAIEMLEEAFVPYPHDKAATLFGKRGRRLFVLGEYQRYMDDFHSMLTCSREADRKDLEGKAMVYLSSSLLTRGNLEEAKEWAEQAVEIGRDLNDKSIMMRALSDLGGVALYMSQFEDALNCYNESLQLSRDLKDERAITRNLSNIGVYCWFVGEYDEAIKYYNQAMKRLEENGDKHLLALNLNNLGAVYYILGRIRGSIRAYQESIVLSRETKNKGLLAYNYNNLGEIYQVLGDLEQASKYHKEAFELVKEVGERYVECDILRNIGLDLHLEGKTVEGLRYLKNALRLSRKVGKNNFVLTSLFDIGCTWLDSGEVNKAEMIGEELMQRLEETDSKELMAKAAYLKTKLLIAKGKLPEAKVEIEKLFGLLQEVQNIFLSLQAQTLRWEISKDSDEGREALENAISIVRDIEMELESKELKDSFLNRKEIVNLLNSVGRGRSEDRGSVELTKRNN
jgi:diguanylate cyclase (GGDEF)-like protein